jgi:hypothetical protein
VQYVRGALLIASTLPSPYQGWQIDTIFMLEALGVCWERESIQHHQESPVDVGVGHE